MSRDLSHVPDSTSYFATTDGSSRHASVSSTSTAVENQSFDQESNRTVAQFIELGFDLLQGPAAFSWSYIRDFMGHVDNCSMLTRLDRLPAVARCLVDCVVLPDAPEAKSSSKIASALSLYSDERHERKVLNVSQLLEWLKPKDMKACRMILFMTDMTPEYAAALVTQIDVNYAGLLREYIQCHLADETEFIAIQPRGPRQKDKNILPRHMTRKIDFVYGFHLPYVALRFNKAGADPRGVRETIPMIKPLHSNSRYALQDDLVCHEGQVSFLIAGSSATDFFAICNVDTWFGSEQGVDAYFEHGQDGPSGGASHSKDYFSDPREYFLLVLSQRFRQIGSEWGNVFTHLTRCLDTYETHYLNTIDSITSEFNDDESTIRTRSYLKATSMLRQYCDTITLITGRLKSYLEKHDSVLFSDCDAFRNDVEDYRVPIEWELAHLDRWQKRLYWRMQRFEVMREGLLSASNLRESRRATKQSGDIGVLTWVTVLYLPFNTAAAVLSMSGQLPETKSWICWTVASVVLVIVTFLSTFGKKLGINHYWRSSKSHPTEMHDVERLLEKPVRKGTAF